MDVRSTNEVEEAIARLHLELCATTRALLAEIAEHDRRRAWADAGCKSEADYLESVLSFSWRTAKTWVRVGHALDRYPRWAESLSEGLVSVDQLASMVDLMARHDDHAGQPAGPFDDPIGPAPDPGAGAADPSGCDPGTSSPGADPAAGPDGTDASAPGGSDPSDPSADPPGADPAAAAAGVLDLAGQLSGRQLAAEAHRARQAACRDANALHRRRSLRAHHEPGERKLSVSGGELYDDQAATVWAALNHYASGCKADPETGRFDALATRFADGLVAMAEAYLAARERIAHHPLVIFHADARLLAGEEGWAETSDYSPLATATIARLACACDYALCADGPGVNPLWLGRTQREASWQQAEIVRRRDGGCRRCGQPRWTKNHHISEWEARRGRTDIDNLVALCSRCHHLVHEGGHRIEGHTDGELRFISPSGHVIVTYPHPPPSRRHRRAPANEAPPRPMPAAAGPMPAGARPMPAAARPMPADARPMPAGARPMSAAAGPMPAAAGPMSAGAGPMSAADPTGAPGTVLLAAGSPIAASPPAPPRRRPPSSAPGPAGPGRLRPGAQGTLL